MLLKGRDTRRNDRDYGICVILLIPFHARAYTLFACPTFSNTKLRHTCARTTPLRESGPSPSNFFSCVQSTRSLSIKREKQYCFHNAFISSHMLIMHWVPVSFSTLSLLPLLRLGSAAHSWTQDVSRATRSVRYACDFKAFNNNVRRHYRPCTHNQRRRKLRRQFFVQFLFYIFKFRAAKLGGVALTRVRPVLECIQ